MVVGVYRLGDGSQRELEEAKTMAQEQHKMVEWGSKKRKEGGRVIYLGRRQLADGLTGTCSEFRSCLFERCSRVVRWSRMEKRKSG